MINIIPAELPTPKLHEYLLGCVAPRPIAFVSTIDSKGNVNLAPFSFFNVFGSNPPTLVFSPARSGRTGKTKHTLDNLYEVGECVVNIVSYDMIHQCNLASAEFEKGVNEFERAGFTQVPSSVVKPPRVGQSKAHIECKVKQIIETGQGGGAGNLVICEVVALHVDESVVDENGSIVPDKFDYVARMGKNYWARIVPEAIVEMPKMPDATKVLGVNNLPEAIRLSNYLTGNEIALLANNTHLPADEAIEAAKNLPDVQQAIAANSLPQLVKDSIAKFDLELALKLAMLVK
jgi:flavin reductase (DIM6/NTAB) family NADH-FMN oxidoreductase RutF